MNCCDYKNLFVVFFTEYVYKKIKEFPFIYVIKHSKICYNKEPYFLTYNPSLETGDTVSHNDCDLHFYSVKNELVI